MNTKVINHSQQCKSSSDKPKYFVFNVVTQKNSTPTKSPAPFT